ncbi:glycine zipper 2TM domain-containing protein [Luteimonas aquatica]|uniref:glycine zipper 2TM domain-containing protein n=1 Tax=Luteimonas aquatica TaxID=450364 RepID=UPI001F598251|nr:glycine zipper 2TM domain-containing protein [Luteimonas aquatica]
MKIRLLGAGAVIAMLAAAGCATTSPGYGGGYGGGSYGSGNCSDCGTVTRIETVARGENVPNATGAVLGGIVGAAAAREIADHNTDSKGRKNTATVAGAVGGALAGNAIQNRVQASSTYRVYVRFNDGRTTTFTQSDLGGIREGSYVEVRGGTAYLR